MINNNKNIFFHSIEIKNKKNKIFNLKFFITLLKLNLKFLNIKKYNYF